MEHAVDEVEEGAGGLLTEASEGLGWGLVSLMDEWAHGVLVTSLGGRLLHANAAARQELGRRRVLQLQGRELRAVQSENAQKLQDALLKVAEGKRGLVTLQGQGAPLTVAVLPLRERFGQPAKAALVFARATVCDSLMLCFFARSHGLTPMEEQVLGILCQGDSAPEVARQLGVAVSTVRSHVRSLCAKTGASGVRELVSRVAVLPPVGPSLRPEPVH